MRISDWSSGVCSSDLEYDQGIRIDENVPIGQGLHRSGLTEGRLAQQRLGTWFNRVPLMDAVPDRGQAVDIATGSKRELAPSDVSQGALPSADLSYGVAETWKLSPDPHSSGILFLQIGGASVR